MNQEPLHNKLSAQVAVPFLALSLLVGLLTYTLWTPFIPAYNKLLAALVNPVLSLTHQAEFTRVHAQNDHLVIVRTDLDPRSSSIPAVNFRWYQFSMVLLLTLLISAPGVDFYQRLKNIVLGIIILLGYHVFVVADQILYLFSTRLGPYSLANYSDLERNIYGSIDAFNIGIGVYGVPVLLWLILSSRNWFVTTAPGHSPRRNESCFCGSGKKYKKCCMPP